MILLKDCYYILSGQGKSSSQGRSPGRDQNPGSGQNLGGKPRPGQCWDILIKDNKIEEIAPDISPPLFDKSRDRIIDASNLVVVPGFINTHHHFYQTLTRNIPEVQNAKLFDWLTHLYEIWKNIDADAVFYSSLVAMAELLKTGCTCSTDHHYLYPDNFSGDLMALQFEAAEKTGLRFSPCRGSMSLSKKDGGLPPDSVVQDSDIILKDSRRVIEEFHDGGDFSMKRIILAPCSPFSVTEKLIRSTAELAREYGVLLHTHLAETQDENDYCLKVHGRRPLELMVDWDFTGSDVSYAHGIFFNDRELEILAQTNTSIAHCPSSNMRLGSGIARIREMVDMGINVALAVDGSASNDTSDFLGEMRQALLLQRIRYGPEGLTRDEVFRMATENGARLLNFPFLGRIEAGWAADLALFNINRIEYAGTLSDPPAALIFAGINHQSEYTIVNGKVVVEKGFLTGLDEEKVLFEANRISARLLRG